MNSVVISQVPDKVTTIDNLDEGEWTDDEIAEDRACKNIQELKISKIATGLIPTANRHKAHLDGGSQAFATNDRSVLWGFKWCTKKNPCRVQLTCADGKSPVVPEGCGAARIPANDAEGHVPTKCCCTRDIPNFMLSPSEKAIQGTLPLTPALALNANAYCPNIFRKGHWCISHLNVRIVHANELVHKNSIPNT